MSFRELPAGPKGAPLVKGRNEPTRRRSVGESRFPFRWVEQDSSRRLYLVKRMCLEWQRITCFSDVSLFYLRHWECRKEGGAHLPFFVKRPYIIPVKVSPYCITLCRFRVINPTEISPKYAHIPNDYAQTGVDNVWMTVERFFLSAPLNFRIFVWKISTFGGYFSKGFFVRWTNKFLRSWELLEFRQTLWSKAWPDSVQGKPLQKGSPLP